MASLIYNRLLANLMNKEVDLEADIIKVALMNNSHVATATDNEWTDVNANEISGAGYIVGGETLAGKSVTQGSPTIWDGTNISWTSATFSVWHAVIYDDTLTNDDLIASIDFGGEVTVSDGTLTIEWSVDGIITLT